MKTYKTLPPIIPIQSRPLKPSSSSFTTSIHIPSLAYPQSPYATNLSKRPRTEKACDSCRRRKVRCELPQDDSVCKQCIQTKGVCTFTTRPRKRGPRGVVQLEKRLERLEQLLADRVQQEGQNEQVIEQPTTNESRQTMETNERVTSLRYSRPQGIINGINDWIYRMCGIDKTTSDTLVKIYFAYVYPVIPVVDKAVFLQQYRDQVDALPSPPLLCAIYGAAVRYYESYKAFGNHTKPPLLNTTGQRTSDSWSQHQMEYVKCNQSPSLPVIQSLVISMQYRSSANCKWTDVWLLNSVAVRMAQDIGLHRNDQDDYLSQSDKETRKRLWGLLYILDRWFSAGTGRPLTAFDEDCDETYPQPIHVDDSVNVTQPSYQTSIPPTTFNIVNHPQLPFFETVAQLAKISKILGNILHELYTPAARKQWMKIGNTGMVDLLEESLGVWRRNLPPFLQIKGTMVNWNPCNDESMTILSGIIGLSYYTSLILLHRPFIQLKSTPSSQLSLKICTNAAIRTVDIIGKLQSRDHLLVTWSYVLYPVFVSSLIHLYNANSSNSIVADVAKANLLRILTTLQLFGKLSPLAEKLHGALYCVAQHRRYLPHCYSSLSDTSTPLAPSCSHRSASTLSPQNASQFTTQNNINTSTNINININMPDSTLSSSSPSSSEYCNYIISWIDNKCTPLSLSDYGNSDHPFDICSLFGLALPDSICRPSVSQRSTISSYSSLPTNIGNNPAIAADRPTRLYEDFQLYSSHHQSESTAPPLRTVNLKRSFYPGNIFWDLPSGMEVSEWPAHPRIQTAL